MGSDIQDCRTCAEEAVDRSAIAGLKFDLSAVVDQMAGCLQTRQPMTAELAEQLHDVRRRAELLFGDAAHS
jgi:hypothetical protein